MSTGVVSVGHDWIEWQSSQWGTRDLMAAGMLGQACGQLPFTPATSPGLQLGFRLSPRKTPQARGRGVDELLATLGISPMKRTKALIGRASHQAKQQPRRRTRAKAESATAVVRRNTGAVLGVR